MTVKVDFVEVIIRKYQIRFIFIINGIKHTVIDDKQFQKLVLIKTGLPAKKLNKFSYSVKYGEYCRPHLYSVSLEYADA